MLDNISVELSRVIPAFRADHEHLYLVRLLGGEYLIRPLTWNEFRRYSELFRADNGATEKILSLALLWPTLDPGKTPGGVYDTLAEQILQVSGFTNPAAFNDGVQWARQQVQGEDNIIVATICRAFPGYTPEMLQELKFLDLMLRFAMAEMMLGGGEEMPQQGTEAYRKEVPKGFNPPTYGPGVVGVPSPPPPVSIDAPPPNFSKDNKNFSKNF